MEKYLKNLFSAFHEFLLAMKMGSLLNLFSEILAPGEAYSQTRFSRALI